MKRALVLSLICVVGLTFGVFAQGVLSGSWITKVCLDPQTAAFSDAITLTSTLTVDYEIGDWTFGMTTVIDEDGWFDQDFSVIGMFGLITVNSTLGFTVDPIGFDEWSTTLTLNMAGVSFSGVFSLKPGIVGLDLTMTAGIGSAVEGTIVLGLGDDDCCFCFDDVKIGLDFMFCDCATILSEIYFTCEGFEYVQFCAEDIIVPMLPWLTFDACVKFEMQTKSLTVTPAFDFGTMVCIDLYFDIFEKGATTYPSATWQLQEIALIGIGISCDLPGGVSFAAISDLIDGGTLVKEPYWEQYSIDVDADACCGGVFEFGLDAYFKDGAGTLFELSLIEADVKVNVTDKFAFTMDLDVDLDAGFTKWCVGFDVTW